MVIIIRFLFLKMENIFKNNLNMWISIFINYLCINYISHHIIQYLFNYIKYFFLNLLYVIMYNHCILLIIINLNYIIPLSNNCLCFFQIILLICYKYYTIQNLLNFFMNTLIYYVYYNILLGHNIVFV